MLIGVLVLSLGLSALTGCSVSSSNSSEGIEQSATADKSAAAEQTATTEQTAKTEDPIKVTCENGIMLGKSSDVFRLRNRP